MERVFRLLKRITLIAGLLLLLAVPASGLISTARNYAGVCYGFTDGQSPCSWGQYAVQEMFWAIFIFIPFLFVATLLWLGMAAAEFVSGLIKKRRERA